jgi:ferric-dicitrate binding protein FerR (iron transport regulator)
MTMPDHDITARVLRLAGAREDANPARAFRVRQAVLAECRLAAKGRRMRRRSVRVAMGLTLAAAVVLAVRIWSPAPSPAASAGDVVATVERLDPGGRRLPAGDESAAHDLTASASIYASDGIATAPDSRLSLRLADGTSLRLDVSSRARLLTAAAIELTAGAVYVDNSQRKQGIEIRTAFGTVQDIGTQFEVRVSRASLRVRVRSGRVTVQQGTRKVLGGPGSELMVAADRVETRDVPAYGPEWAWTATLAPSIGIEGRPLTAVLEELCREHGWTLRYSDPALEREASAALLRGSLEGLTPEDALKAVFTASDFRHRFQQGEVVVIRAESRNVP